MKIDPYNNKECYLKWKEQNEGLIPKIGKGNSDILLRYLNDMEIGINVGAGSKKGARSYIRLKALREKNVFIMKKVFKLYKRDDITKITEEEVHALFSGMENGTILREDGRRYIAVVDYVKIFKAFWHWWIKINRKNGVEIKDITLDLNTKQEKPDWVYLTEEQVKRLYDSAKPYYKVLIMFLFDTGIRAPTEMMNIKVSDFYNDFKELQIREEVSKTFGRRIKLMLCSDLIKEYIKNNNLCLEDYLFKVKPQLVNLYLKRLAIKLFGDKVSPAGQKYSELSMYDFRHCSCCYWLPRYKSESALKYRFGWKKSDKIHYYSELLGMRDTISEDDLLVDVTKTEIEQQLEKTRKENEVLQERMKNMEIKMGEIMEITNQMENAKGGV